MPRKELEGFTDRVLRVSLNHKNIIDLAETNPSSTLAENKLIAGKLRFLMNLKLQPVRIKEIKRKGHTGWKILGKLKGGTNRRRMRKRAAENLAEKEKRRKIDDRIRTQKFKLSYQNINGMSEDKLEEIQDYLEQYNIDILVLSEAKKQEGDLLQDFNIDGYQLEEHLRGDAQEGGLLIYTKEDLNTQVKNWRGLLDSHDEWMESERQWRKVKINGKDHAFCSVYLRIDSAVFPQYYENNVKLMDKIKEEMAVLRSEGMRITVIGDMNGHIGNKQPYGIPGNPHTLVNRNGKLIIEVFTSENMQLLNSSTWHTGKGDIIQGEGLCSYYKPRVDGIQSSIIDYAFTDRETLQGITKFEVMDGAINIPSSDHVPLLMHLENDDEVEENAKKEKRCSITSLQISHHPSKHSTQCRVNRHNTLFNFAERNPF